MSKVFKPRRGKASTMSTKNPVLESGEFFVEVPNSGVGTGAGKIKMGDGTTAYNSLPYLIDGTSVSSQTGSVTADSSTTVAAALNNVTNGKTVAGLFGSLKQAVSLLNGTVTTLNDDTTASLNLKLDSSMLMNKAFVADNSITIAGNSSEVARFSGLQQEGYICLGLAGFNTTSYHAVLLTALYYYGNDDNFQMRFRNISSSSISIRPEILMLYVKDTNGTAPSGT